MVSFPAGIVGVLVGNSKHERAPLMFRIKNFDVLESIVPNKQLISEVKQLPPELENGPPATSDSRVFQFDMKALRELLKAQSEQNPTASYFNIDILKYQVMNAKGWGGVILPPQEGGRVILAPSPWIHGLGFLSG